MLIGCSMTFELGVMQKDEQLVFTLVGTGSCSLLSVHGAL